MGNRSFRGEIWHRCKKLLKNGYRTEAYILLLATWNFARFRYFMKTFDLKKFEDVIEKIQPLFDKLKDKIFEKVDFNNSNIRDNIKTIYNSLKPIVEQTGATKIMALTNTNLFVMWDTKIRRKYKIKNKASGKDYIEFLIKMRDVFKDVELSVDLPRPKAIDEFNYKKTQEETKKDKIKEI